MSDPSPTATDKLPKDLAAEKGMVNVQIDGTWHQFPRGTRIIEACKQVGIEVPHYCYHPKLSAPGNCRMCLIQAGMPPRPAPGQDPSYGEDGYQAINWSPRPMIACANTVSENMGIRTKGELVEDCRKGVLEFILINHPLDCPICDKAGECELQEYSVEHGRGYSRFLDMKVKKPKNVDIGPRITLDVERCIMCSRCVRFMDEVADDPVLGFTQRGTHVTLGVHPGRRLDSNYSLNTVDICPVGALTSNDFRFKMRTWFLKETDTIDVNCGTGCNITVWSRENVIHRITPRRNDEVNSTWMPDSHRLNFHYIDSDERLTEPLIKSDRGTHQPASWKQAIEAIQAAFEQFPAEQIAIVASARMTNEELYLVKKLAGEKGIEKLTTVPREGENDDMLIAADRNPNTLGAKLVWHSDNPAAALESIRNGVRSGDIKALLVFTEDLTAEAGFTSDDLAKLEFLAAVQLLAGATANAAHVVFPGASFAEKRGTMVNITGRIQCLNRAIDLPGQAHDDWEIIRDILGASGPYLIEEVLKEMRETVEEFVGLTFSKIGKQGVVVKETGVKIPLLEKERARIAAGEING